MIFEFSWWVSNVEVVRLVVAARIEGFMVFADVHFFPNQSVEQIDDCPKDVQSFVAPIKTELNTAL